MESGTKVTDPRPSDFNSKTTRFGHRFFTVSGILFIHHKLVRKSSKNLVYLGDIELMKSAEKCVTNRVVS